MAEKTMLATAVTNLAKTDHAEKIIGKGVDGVDDVDDSAIYADDAAAEAAATAAAAEAAMAAATAVKGHDDESALWRLSAARYREYPKTMADVLELAEAKVPTPLTLFPCCYTIYTWLANQNMISLFGYMQILQVAIVLTSCIRDEMDCRRVSMISILDFCTCIQGILASQIKASMQVHIFLENKQTTRFVKLVVVKSSMALVIRHMGGLCIIFML